MVCHQNYTQLAKLSSDEILDLTRIIILNDQKSIHPSIQPSEFRQGYIEHDQISAQLLRSTPCSYNKYALGRPPETGHFAARKNMPGTLSLTSALCLGGLHCMYDESSIVSRSTHVSVVLLSPSPWPSPPLLPPPTVPMSPPLATPCAVLARLIPSPWYTETREQWDAHVFPGGALQESRKVTDLTRAARAPRSFYPVSLACLVFRGEGSNHRHKKQRFPGKATSGTRRHAQQRD